MQIEKLQLKCTNVNIRGEAQGDSGKKCVAVDLKLEAMSVAIGVLRYFTTLDKVTLTTMQGAGVGKVTLIGDFNHHNVTIKGEGELPDVDLADAKINKVETEMSNHEPGFVYLALRVQGRPSSRTDTGKLAELVDCNILFGCSPGQDLAHAMTADSDDSEATTE